MYLVEARVAVGIDGEQDEHGTEKHMRDVNDIREMQDPGRDTQHQTEGYIEDEVIAKRNELCQAVVVICEEVIGQEAYADDDGRACLENILVEHKDPGREDEEDPEKVVEDAVKFDADESHDLMI